MNLIFEIAGYVGLVIAGLVPIANPLAAAPVFISMTAELSKTKRVKTATYACLYMAAILIVFLFFGVFLLKFFGISLEALRIAGGLIIAYMGFRMLFPDSQKSSSGHEAVDDPQSVAFVPLALPMMSGPGAISVIISMAAHAGSEEILTNRVAGYAIVTFGIFLSALICWLVLRSSDLVFKLLGHTGIDALTRIMGFLLVCVGCQFVLSSLQPA